MMTRAKYPQTMVPKKGTQVMKPAMKPAVQPKPAKPQAKPVKAPVKK